MLDLIGFLMRYYCNKLYLFGWFQLVFFAQTPAVGYLTRAVICGVATSVLSCASPRIAALFVHIHVDI